MIFNAIFGLLLGYLLGTVVYRVVRWVQGHRRKAQAPHPADLKAAMIPEGAISPEWANLYVSSLDWNTLSEADKAICGRVELIAHEIAEGTRPVEEWREIEPMFVWWLSARLAVEAGTANKTIYLDESKAGESHN